MWLMLSRKGKQITLMRLFYNCGWGTERKQEEEEGEKEEEKVHRAPKKPLSITQMRAKKRAQNLFICPGYGIDSVSS